MTPGSFHYLFAIFEMAANGYLRPEKWFQPGSRDPGFVYRNFDSCFDHELGLEIDLARIAKEAGPSRPTFIADAMPWVVWIMNHYARKFPECAGRIVFVIDGRRQKAEELYPVFESSFPKPAGATN